MLDLWLEPGAHAVLVVWRRRLRHAWLDALDENNELEPASGVHQLFRQQPSREALPFSKLFLKTSTRCSSSTWTCTSHSTAPNELQQSGLIIISSSTCGDKAIGQLCEVPVHGPCPKSIEIRYVAWSPAPKTGGAVSQACRGCR